MKKLVIITLCFFMSISVLYGGEIEKTFSFSSSDISFIHNNGYDIIKMSGNVSTDEIGKPSLPRLVYTFVIPSSAEIENVEVISCKEIPIPGKFFVSPSQPFYPLSQDRPEFVEPHQETYNSSSAYPGDIVYSVTSGSKTGFRLCGITLCPIQYYPSEGRLILYESITVRLSYKEGVRNPESRTPGQVKQALQSITVVNPEDITSFSPPLMRPDEEIQYLIITEDDFVPYFEPLAEWKTKKGIPTAIRTISWIDANYTGYDMAEKVRNYEQEVYADSGLVWVIIGVDAEEANWFGILSNDIVRGCEAPFCHSPCLADLYFGDLDGTWDENGDFIYGEPEDNVDMYSDVYVGRASADNITEVTTFVDKTLIYEKTPATSYEQSILLVAASLFSPYNYWGDDVCDSIAIHIPADWNINKLYQSEGDDLTTLPDVFDEGYGYYEFASHGKYDDLHYENNEVIMDTYDIDNLTNAPEFSIGTAIACYNGWFCHESVWGDCFCEHLMHNPEGGTVACIGNGGFGWGAVGYSELGPSELLDLEFYKTLLNENIYHIGVANAFARDYYIPYALDPNNVNALNMRICLYEWNIFGDPNLPMRKKNIPDTLSVTFNESVQTGAQNFDVFVEIDDFPVPDALVCTMKEDEVYAYGYTDALGTVTLSIEPITEGTMDLTVTAQDCFPFEGTVSINTTGIENSDLNPIVTQLKGNSPNPFNPETTISFSLAKDVTNAKIEIYNIKGQKVKQLNIENCKLNIGKVVWDGTNDSNQPVSSGIYFYKMKACGRYTSTRKMILMK